LSALRDRWVYAGLAALIVIVGLSTLAQRPLFNPDEGRYAEIPREMLSSGDWVIPHLNGLDYLEKPPLQYWGTALGMGVFGENAFGARLYMAVTALGTLALVGFLGKHLGGEDVGWRAAAVLSGTFMFLVLGQLLTLDMSLTFYMTLSLVSFLIAQKSVEKQRRWMLLAWTGAALAVLTKGLVAAAIPAAVLVLYSLLSRDFSPWRKLHLRWGLPLFLGLTVPWHWAAASRVSDFLQFFFVHEHLARYLTPISDREEPWWFFVWVFLAGSVPWTVPALRVLATGWRRPPSSRGVFNPTFFLWLWVVFVLVFFSLSDSKLMPYILPAMPPLAVLIAVLPTATLKRDFMITALLTILVGVALGVASFNWARVIGASDRAATFLPLAKSIAQIAALFMVSGAFVRIPRNRDATRAGVFLGVGWCLAGLLVVRAASIAAPIYSGVELAAAIPAAERDAPIYSVRTYDQSLTFYLRRPVTLVAYRGEFDYGLRKTPDVAIADIEEFLRVWGAQSRAFAVMNNSTFNELTERGTSMRVVSRNVGKVLVARE
jgi:4-amino-4-deoxy-L-arabinose transferase-like glycosyltransferase